MTSASRRDGCVAFDLPDFTEEPDDESSPTFYLYAIVESANTACIPTLSANEKRADKNHRNINRRVSPSVFIGFSIVVIIWQAICVVFM